MKLKINYEHSQKANEDSKSLAAFKTHNHNPYNIQNNNNNNESFIFFKKNAIKLKINSMLKRV